MSRCTRVACLVKCVGSVGIQAAQLPPIFYVNARCHRDILRAGNYRRQVGYRVSFLLLLGLEICLLVSCFQAMWENALTKLLILLF
jgi:hypothetical protein